MRMRTRRFVSSITLVAILATPVIAAGQQTGATSIEVTGDVTTPFTLSAEAMKAMPRAKVESTEDGRTVVYEGVLVTEILKRAGAPQGADLRGNALASYVIVSAADGYQVVFSLAELDPDFAGNNVIVADTLDGKPLFAYQGPFRIVSPKDTRAARSVRMLESIRVVRLRK